ncbi:MAG TPA: phosphatase PAP2 family protein [Hyphomicrobium sp.]|nr:phosphatase PAP2 family protein [Hyphomicrobium sp.]
MSSVDPFGPSETRFRREFAIGATGIAAVLAVLFVAQPDLDLAISSVARDACAVSPASPRAAWCMTYAVDLARHAFMAIFILSAIGIVAWAIRELVVERNFVGTNQLRCGFMIAVLVMGPGVVANLILKDNVGRPRPRDVIEFGGNKEFSPALVPSQECAKNCSFVSGEASSMFALFFGLALAVPRYRRQLFVAGVTIGLLAGGVRIIQGAHFFSDVLFAGVFMALTVSLLHVAFIGAWRDQTPPARSFRDPLGAVMKLRRIRI